jgi:uncharacterized Ntn-hydrolase superfamily protein
MTFSIVARCPETGHLGVAVSSAVPAVGAMCPYVRYQAGAVSTQSWVNPYLALKALDLMALGVCAEEALEFVLKTDQSKQLRQIGIVDAKGSSASWTGKDCTEWAGHITGHDFAIQGNMLVDGETLTGMQQAFLQSRHSELAERLLLALEAGQRAGGDKRGRQSASLKIYSTEDYALWDLRVDEHAQPVEELRRIYKIALHQLFPFIQGMPSRTDAGNPAPHAVVEMLALSPPNRPGGGGSAR